MHQKMRLTKIVIGFGLLAGGIAMLALPGPGWLTIAAALALLAAEFAWARRALDRLKSLAVSCRNWLSHGGHMASKLGKRIVRAVSNALLERDRAELRVADALLSVIEPPRRPGKTPRRHPAKRRRR